MFLVPACKSAFLVISSIVMKLRPMVFHSWMLRHSRNWTKTRNLSRTWVSLFLIYLFILSCPNCVICVLQPRNMMLSLLVKLWSSRFPVCWALVWTRLVNSLDPWLTPSQWCRKLRKLKPPSSSRWRRYVNNNLILFAYAYFVYHPSRCCASALLSVTSVCPTMIWPRTFTCQSTSWSLCSRSTGKTSDPSTSRLRWVLLSACTNYILCTMIAMLTCKYKLIFAKAETIFCRSKFNHILKKNKKKHTNRKKCNCWTINIRQKLVNLKKVF